MHTTQQAIDWLYSLERRGIVYKLERMERALALLGDPHLALTAVHIAGTKGKGSVAAMLDSILRAAGYRCGLYTKPHLVSLCERFRIDGSQIPMPVLTQYIGRLRDTFESSNVELTFFEFTVAMMFLYFAEQDVDIAIIETGMGGRLDSTNVVRPILSVITPLGFDHTEYLGSTIESIAREKGGIIKPYTPAVIGVHQPEARQLLETIAQERRSPTVMLDRDFFFEGASNPRCLKYRGVNLSLDEVEVRLPGRFQHENAAIALAASEMISAMGYTVSERAIRCGLAQVVWPGRLDTVHERPRVILDCAHNEMSVRALVEALEVELGCDVKPHLIFGCQVDKDWKKMAELLAPRVSDAILTRAAPKQPVDPQRLAEAFSPLTPTKVIRDPRQAIELALKNSAKDEIILVTGSIYLVGEVYSYFLARQGRSGLFPDAAA